MPRKRTRFFRPKNWERKAALKKKLRVAPNPEAKLPAVSNPEPGISNLEPQTPSTICSPQDMIKLIQIPSSWLVQNVPSSNRVQIYQLSSSPSTSSQPPVISHSLTIYSDFTWSLSVHNQIVTSASCSMLSQIPNHLSPDSAKTLLKLVDKLKVCPGQPDVKFVEMIETKHGKLTDCKGEVVSFLDSFAPVICNEFTHYKTVRPVKCELLILHGKCSVCQKYRSTLRVISNRFKARNAEKLTDSSSHSNYRFLNTPEKKGRLTNLRTRVRSAEKEVRELKIQIERLVQKSGETLDDQLHSDFATVMRDHSAEIDEVYPEGSFAHLFWTEQLKAASLKDSRQMRWHPLIIRWCINLMLMSSSTYHATRTAGFIKLPSERTLRDYTNCFQHQAGYQVEVLGQLQKESNVDNLPDNKRWCGIVIDEMKIREGLVYNKHSGEICGFCEMGDINDSLSALEKKCLGKNENPVIAKHNMLVVMVRGIFFKLNFPFGHFAGTDLTSDQLFSIIWEAIRLVESIGLKALFVTADGASPNRKFFKMHKETVGNSSSSGGSEKASKEDLYSKLTYRTRNRYSADGKRWIYFFSDPPHLIKTARNCLQHSAFGGTRLMNRNSKFILWKHIQDVYEKVSNIADSSKGLSLLPKITFEHIHLSSYSKMRVDLAAQVLSTSMAEALAYFGDPDTSETEIFVRYFDRFFDCLNVRNKSGIKGKNDLKAYTSPDDERLSWIENTFLKYLDDWEHSCQSQNHLETAERRKMCISEETLEGLRITVKSFVEMTKFLLSQPDSDELFLLSERVSQDPLENYFGQQRQRGSRCGNPNFKECLQNAVGIRAQRSLELDRVRGNCRQKRLLGNDNFKVNEKDNEHLPKKKKKFTSLYS